MISMCQPTVRKNWVCRRREENGDHWTLLRVISKGCKWERSRGGGKVPGYRDLKFSLRITGFILNRETMSFECHKLGGAGMTRYKFFKAPLVLSIE